MQTFSLTFPTPDKDEPHLTPGLGWPRWEPAPECPACGAAVTAHVECFPDTDIYSDRTTKPREGTRYKAVGICPCGQAYRRDLPQMTDSEFTKTFNASALHTYIVDTLWPHADEEARWDLVARFLPGYVDRLSRKVLVKIPAGAREKHAGFLAKAGTGFAAPDPLALVEALVGDEVWIFSASDPGDALLALFTESAPQPRAKAA